jgi:hypothetical protein
MHPGRTNSYHTAYASRLKATVTRHGGRSAVKLGGWEMLDWDAPTGGYLLQASFARSSRGNDDN